MSLLLRMLNRQTWPGTRSATFLQALERGHMFCVEPAGQMTGRSFREVVLASLTARQAKELGLLTSGTCGRPSTTSSASADLSQSLANKLEIKTRYLGSTLFTLTWKTLTTPSGRLIPLLRAMAHRTSGKDSTGSVRLKYSGWATCTHRDYKTPNKLPFSMRGGGTKGEQLANQTFHLLQTEYGKTVNGLCVTTANTDQLNPSFTRWLLGLPPVWDACADMATDSLLNKQSSS